MLRCDFAILYLMHKKGLPYATAEVTLTNVSISNASCSGCASVINERVIARAGMCCMTRNEAKLGSVQSLPLHTHHEDSIF